MVVFFELALLLLFCFLGVPLSFCFEVCLSGRNTTTISAVVFPVVGLYLRLFSVGRFTSPVLSSPVCIPFSEFIVLFNRALASAAFKPRGNVGQRLHVELSFKEVSQGTT